MSGDKLESGVLIHLVGPAGVGKLTIARELAPLFQAKIIDNHWINNPIFDLLSNDRVTPYPEAIWAEVDKVREAVLSTIVHLSAPEANYIFTNVLFDDDRHDRPIMEQIADAARRRRSAYIPVRLQCSAAVLAQRIVSPERAVRLKSMDAAGAARNAMREVIITGSPDEYTLDTSNLSPAGSANRIAAHVLSGCRRA